VGGRRHGLQRARPIPLLRRALSGRIRSEDSLAERKETVVVDPGASGDRLDIFSSELPCGRFWGHVGVTLDYGTIVKAS
jgi:hypothetical protein